MKKYLWVGVAVVCVALFLFVAVHMYARWQRDQYFGDIARISGSQIVFRDTRVGERILYITPTTEIRRGWETEQATLHVGEHVIIFGEENEGVIQATFIRIVTDDWDAGLRQKR